MKLNIKSRVVIDGDAYNTFNPDDGIYFGNSIAEKLSDDQRLIATPIIRGYALKNKKWLELYIDGVQDIKWDTQAFDSLVLPHAQQDLKQLILAFADAHSKHIDGFDDIIQGKGRGVTMLLSSPPEVGKTLTAESVAEVMKVPLYLLSAGDLGTSASSVERNLKDILSIVPRWNAVLLLDEADVFMEARNATDLARNELVSIFLRMLEYYEVSSYKTSNPSNTNKILFRDFSSLRATARRISILPSSPASTCLYAIWSSTQHRDGRFGRSSLAMRISETSQAKTLARWWRWR